MLQTHMLRYCEVSQGFTPPWDAFFIASFVPQDVLVEDFLVIPFVGFPLGSTVAIQN